MKAATVLMKFTKELNGAGVVPTHVGLTLIGTILLALSVIFRVWG